MINLVAQVDDSDHDLDIINKSKDMIKSGQHRPILINKDNEVIDGNHTLKAYQELNIDPPLIYQGTRADFYNAVAKTNYDGLKAIYKMIDDGTAVLIESIQIGGIEMKKEDKLELKQEGAVLELGEFQNKDQEGAIFDDTQVILTVNNEISDSSKAVESEEKTSFEDFVKSFEGFIDMKFNQIYAGISKEDEEDLWQDVAQELYLKSRDYIITENKEPENVENKEPKEVYVIKEDRLQLILSKIVFWLDMNTNFSEYNNILSKLGITEDEYDSIEKIEPSRVADVIKRAIEYIEEHVDDSQRLLLSIDGIGLSSRELDALKSTASKVNENLDGSIVDIQQEAATEEHGDCDDDKLTESTENNPQFNYMLLDRMKEDCKYFLGNGNRYEKFLWAGNVEDQIAKMKELYNSFPEGEKPEWISMEDIENFEKEMKDGKVNESVEGMEKIATKQMPAEGYRYITTHGVGPGTLPKDVQLFKSEEINDNGRIAIYISRPLTSDELNKYDIKPEWIQESAKLEENITSELLKMECGR